ncbi:undecaprenyldiphospho-muramoylpentapeptide beta-N-acetylglucosaminyltransferase [uncultured Adlercreutzia sp.]|uniref:undecaprenyldiphospho-muramoylpentapeptide beta-N-acetylglucosaminyltransferase n=1 Tax=uncultured Adlercreutzia sp. TaxID=875803 RepID=UPI002675BB7C|nr:undecaprenyldiphospho-muramoylpentapeptide beta-N-acetylglucosaminyltransferase [uncultured Adlercreutzia sp.]
MLAVLSGGGTAGHINPALALAEELSDRGWEVRFAGTPGGVEARLVPAAGIPFQAFEASGFDRAHPLSLPRGVAKIAASTAKARAWFREIEPDVVVGFGGYVSIPVARAAEKAGIPVVLHEQNSVMGMANKYLAKKAAAVCLTYEHSARDLPAGAPVHLTGNPVRRQVIEADRAEGRAMLGAGEGDLVLLVFGGSLGARHINEGLVALKEDLLARPNLRIVHITGPKELDAVREALALTDDEAARWQLLGYQDRMGETMAAADAIVSRAGATSLAEISARAIPALLVPFPYATEDHQTTNARAYVDAGCALMVPDAEVGGDAFARALFSLIDDADVRAAQTAAARARKTVQAAALLADVVEGAATGAPGAVQ